MYDVFISHSSLDKPQFVEPLVSELEHLGLRVWYDKYNIQRGDKIKDSIINGINGAVIFVAIISSHYYSSNWVSWELGAMQVKCPDNFIPIIFPDAKDMTGQKYPFILEHNYILATEPILAIAKELNSIVLEKKQDYGFWYIEKTDLKKQIKDMHSYNSFKLDQIAIHLSHIAKNLNTDLLSALNEVRLVLEIILSDVAGIENVYISEETAALDTFLKMGFFSENLKEHFRYLQRLYLRQLRSRQNNQTLSQEDLYLVQFSLHSIIEWYMLTYFKKPILKQRKLVAVAPDDFTREDIYESYEIEKLVLPPDVIASPSTALEWFEYNPLTMIGARDTDTGKLVGFFNTLPVSDNIFEQIRSGNFDDTHFTIDNIRQYDIPGFYKLYLCSFCIHPAYNTTMAFRIIYTGFIDFLISLASDREIYISDIIADGVTSKGANLCESIGMYKVTKSSHKSSIYSASLIPPAYTTLKLNNKAGHKLIEYYQRVYNEYKEIF